MARGDLGLLDTAPGRRDVRLGLACVGLLSIAFFAILPWKDLPLGEVGGFIPMVDAVMCVGELIIATMLYGQAAMFRSRAATILASGYAFGALLIIAHALTFPGAFTPDGLLGAKTNTSAWIGMINGLALPAAVNLYVLRRSAEVPGHFDHELPGPAIRTGLAGAVVLAILVTVLTTAGHGYLPSLFLSSGELNFVPFAIVCVVTIGLTLAAMVLLWLRRRSVLDMWLLITMFGWLLHWVLTIALESRFTLGWYGRFVLQAGSSLVVVVALIAETNRLYTRLAHWSSARQRERETRLMSLDAIAASYSHEVGQPLAGVTFSAAAGLSWLTREQPDPERAIECLRETLKASRRTFEVLESVRTTFEVGSGSMTKFAVNDLVRETASLLSGRFASHKIALHLSLDEAQPVVFANRVRIQRVLVNLLNNAVEALDAVEPRNRRIALRTTTPDSESLVIEVRDTGPGIPSDKLADIFDPFVTTKPSGTGLGLSLSTIIAEEHGGRLWAAHNDDGGATFNLQLPRNAG